MEYNEFVEEIRCNVEANLSCDGEVRMLKIMRNNGCELDGLTIVRKGCPGSPTIYLNGYYNQFEAGRSIVSITREVLNTYESGREKLESMAGIFNDFEEIKKRVAYKLVNYEKNKELLQDVPHKRFMNLAVVFYCLIERESNYNATALIHNSHLGLWGVSESEIYSLARKNTPNLLPYRITRIDEVVDIPKDSCREDDMMYILTNDSGINGAASLLYDGVIDEFAERFAADVIVIPSSVHEVLLVPLKEEYDVSELNMLVKEVNNTIVDEEETLADNVYIYRRKNRIFTLTLD